MKDIQQLIKKNSQEGRYENIFPKTYTDAVKDKESGKSLIDILSSFNMYFLSYNGSRELTRLQVPLSLRKTGLWITYVLYDKTVVTEWYAGEAIDDTSFSNGSNWRDGSNSLVGDISVSSDGYWVVNGVITTTKAQGEQGIQGEQGEQGPNGLTPVVKAIASVSNNAVGTPTVTVTEEGTELDKIFNFVFSNLKGETGNPGIQGITPMLRVGSNNHLQASYTNGSSWVDVSTNPVYTQFRINNNKLEQSVDLGDTWIVVSDELAYQFRNSGNKLQVSKDLGVTWEDISDYVAAWFKFTGTTGSSQADNVGKIQISRDNGASWTDLSGEFTNSLHIKGYVATVPNLPSTAVQGDIYGVGPTYDPSDTEQTNPIYQLYVKDSTGWVNNGRFTSISAGVVQELGNSETAVMSQKAVTDELTELLPIEINAASGQYIATNQGVGSVCPMTTTEFESCDYVKIDAKAGELYNVIGVGGNSPRLWALIDKSNNTILSVADAQDVSSQSAPQSPFDVTIDVQSDCWLIINVYNEKASPSYGNKDNTPYAINKVITIKESFSIQNKKIDDLYAKTGSNVIEIVGFGVEGIPAGIKNAGEIYYNTNMKLLRRAITVNPGSYETIPFIDGVLYYSISEKKYYEWDGIELSQTDKYPTKGFVLEKLDGLNKEIAEIDIYADYTPISEPIVSGKYISTNQGVGNVCTMAETTSPFFDYVKIDAKAGEVYSVKGVGGNSPRLWALIDKENNTIISAAEEGIIDSSEVPQFPHDITIDVQSDCWLIINVYNNNANPSYGNTSHIPYSINKCDKKTVKEKIKELDERSSINVDFSIILSQGGILRATGEKSTNGDYYNKTLSTDFIKVDNLGLTISLAKGYSFKIYEYNSDKEYIGTYVKTYNYKFYKKQPNTEYIRLTVFNNPYGTTVGNNYFPTSELPQNFNALNGIYAELKVESGFIEYTNTPFNPLKYIKFDGRYAQDISIGSSISIKEQLFENTLEKLKNIGFSVEIKNIGKDQSGTYDMKGYVITPPSYTHTMAFTAHIHGNEKYNPCALIYLFKAIADKLQDNETILWYKKNVRWIGVFICNPYGYVANTRAQSRSININRNFDYNWNNQTDSNKGASVMSEQETKNIVNFFTSYIDSIDTHCDWHDMWTNDSPYGPFYNYHTAIDNDIINARVLIEEYNNVPKAELNPYAGKTGCVTNWFSELHGIPSLTSEYSQSYWGSRGYSDSEKINQACIMTVNFLSALINFYLNRKECNDKKLYAEIGVPSFRSETLALNTWTYSDIQNAAKAIGFDEKTEVGQVKSYINKSTNKRKTILVTCDYEDNSNISKLLVLSCMRVLKDKSNHFPHLKRLLNTCDIIFIPHIQQYNEVNTIANSYSSDFTILISKELTNGISPKIVCKEKSDIDTYISDNYLLEIDNMNDKFTSLSNLSYIVYPNSMHINQPDSYSYIVEKWVEAIISVLIVNNQY